MLRVGDLVAGWASAGAAVAGELPRALRVSAVQRVVEDVPPVLGAQLLLSSGERLTLPSFVTANHALLDADGIWRAADPTTAQAELKAYSANATTAALRKHPIIGTLAAGIALLRAPGAATVTNVTASAEQAMVQELLVSEGSQPKEVFSLELEVDGYAVYVVNGLLAMD